MTPHRPESAQDRARPTAHARLNRATTLVLLVVLAALGVWAAWLYAETADLRELAEQQELQARQFQQFKSALNDRAPRPHGRGSPGDAAPKQGRLPTEPAPSQRPPALPGAAQAG